MWKVLILTLCGLMYSHSRYPFDDCIAKEGSDPDTVQQVSSSMHVRKFITDEKGMALLRCYLVEKGSLKPNGEPNFTADVAGQERLLQRMEKCNEIKNENRCEAGYQLQRCMNNMYADLIDD
ncbi:uncharacterized protein LOC116179326 [Photinus pyralis]|uniref:uncharacterized protein LOC116178218 n=1 Tax=Photinus pyralis TaxID=7054 RepID=UPI0012671B10|nr:uncharacterized protein LOC116178218 [Photinus pyralis]XP_031354955.1 uncharacterized protein LOC116179326 [Photinus pyralis]